MIQALRIEREARDELREAMHRYSRERKGLGLAFEEDVHAALQRICEHPAIGKLEPGTDPEKNIRQLVIQRFPYAVIYTQRHERIHVLAIAHAHRRPRYWAGRRPSE